MLQYPWFHSYAGNIPNKVSLKRDYDCIYSNRLCIEYPPVLGPFETEKIQE